MSEMISYELRVMNCDFKKKPTTRNSQLATTLSYKTTFITHIK